MRRKTTLALAVLAAVLTVPGYARSEPEDPTRHRNSDLNSLGGQAGAAALIMRGKVDYMPHLLDHARALAAAGRHVHDVFPEDPGLGDSDAWPVVWKSAEAFKQAAAKAGRAAAASPGAVESGGRERMGGRFKDLGQSCAGCHDEFREERH